MVKNLSSSTEHVGLIPGQGTKIPPAAGQLSQQCKEAKKKKKKIHSLCFKYSEISSRMVGLQRRMGLGYDLKVFQAKLRRGRYTKSPLCVLSFCRVKFKDGSR